jgi:hypothetical protein
MEQPMSSICQASKVEWKELLTKGVTTGMIAALASMLLFENDSISVAGIKLPGLVAMGLGAATRSLSADLVHKYIIPHIPTNQKYEKAEFAVISIATSDLGTFAVSNLIGSALMAPTFAFGGHDLFNIIVNSGNDTLYTFGYPIPGFLEPAANCVFEKVFDFITDSSMLVGISHLFFRQVYNNIQGKISCTKYIYYAKCQIRLSSILQTQVD